MKTYRWFPGKPERIRGMQALDLETVTRNGRAARLMPTVVELDMASNTIGLPEVTIEQVQPNDISQPEHTDVRDSQGDTGPATSYL